MKYYIALIAALAIATVAQAAAVPTENEPAALDKKCGCMRWCKSGNFILCCDFVPCSSV
ncbi:hypothetical protein BGZ95_001542 [Linnemannia exigua]|uniref:Uncharacterized protein n=1 Tax=Linnemannia exigua TaxID=604196 RepID=A0AAD4D7B3_9FUNG|nr:hypothetical protein BGZ95_001542 [Linnemannia exigua]